MEEMKETVRRVVHGLLDVQTAFDPDSVSETAIDMAVQGLMDVPGAVVRNTNPAVDRGWDVTGLLSGVNMLNAQLIAQLSDALGQPREAIVNDLRGWADRQLDT